MYIARLVFLTLALALTVALAPVTLAADITLTLTAPQMQRVQDALGAAYDLRDGGGARRPATNAEIKAALTAHLRGIVLQAEREAHLQTFKAAPLDPQ